MPRHRDDEGFTLVESMVALVVAAVLALVVAGVLVQAFGVNRANAQRTIAANIASGQIETLRAQRAIDLTDGRSTTNVVGSDGQTYSVTTDTALLLSSADTSICSATGNGRISFKRIRVTVDWPSRGSTQPVTIDSTKALGVGAGGLDETKGVLAVSVTGGDGRPMPGLPVTLAPTGAVTTTGSDGCAVFANLATTSVYEAQLNVAGYVGQEGLVSVKQSSIGITANRVSRVGLRYDRPVTLQVTNNVPTGAVVPAGITTSMDYTGGWLITPRALQSCTTTAGPCTTASGAVTTVANLFPDATTRYGVWPGTCTVAKPTNPAGTPIAPGTTGSVSVDLGTVPLQVKNSSGAVQAGAVVYASPTGATGGCTPAESAYSATADVAGKVSLALPPGSWRFSAYANGSSPTAAVTVTAGQQNPTTTQVVK